MPGGEKSPSSISAMNYPALAPSGRAGKYKGGIGAAKAEGIGERVVHLALLRSFGHQIDVAGGGRVIEVQGRRHHPITDREDREDRFDAAGGTEKMPDGGFCRGHRQFVRMPAEQPLDRTEFDLIAQWGRGAMGVDVIDPFQSDASTLQSVAHRPKCPVAIL